MATNYPGSLDTSTQQPSPSASTEMDDSGFEHDVVHANHSGAIIAVETKVGTGASTPVANSVLGGTGSGTSAWTTTPTLGGLTVNSGGTNNVATFESTDAGALISLKDDTTTGTAYVGLRADGDILKLRSNNTNQVTISANGNATFLGKLLAPDGSASTPAFSFSGDPNTGMLRSGTDELGLATGGTQRLTIKQSGNVGIGTTSPANPLHVNGGTANFIARLESTDSEAYLGLQDSGSSTAGHVAVGAIGNDLVLRAGNNNAVRVKAHGDVGIGTTSPGQRLHVNSGATNTAAVFESTDTEVILGLKDDTTSGNAHVGIRATGNDLSLRAGNTNQVVIYSGGTAQFAGAVITTDGTAANPGLSFTSDTDTGMFREGANILALATGGTKRVTVGSSGDVTLTGALLAPNGSNSAPSLSFTNDSNTGFYVAGNDGVIRFVGNGTPGGWLSSTGIRTVDGSASVPSYSFTSDSNTGMFRSAADELAFTTGGTQRVTIASDGDVGIGTTSPAHPLDVVGTARFSTSVQFNNGSQVIRNWGSGAIDNLLPGSAFGGILEGNTSGHFVIGIRDNDADDSFSVISGGGDQTTNDYDTVVAYFGANGEVGIGTSSPAATLHVAGNMQVGTSSTNYKMNLYRQDTGTADHINIYNGSTLVGTIGAEDSTWLRLNQEVAKNIYTPRLLRADGGFQAGSGSSSAPAYSFQGDTNTGIYRVTTDQIGFATGGTLRGRFWSQGLLMGSSAAVGSAQIGTGTGSASAPVYHFYNDTNTGMYRSGADQVAFTAGGVLNFQILNNGVFVPSGSNYFGVPDTGTGNDAEWAHTGFGTYLLRRNSSLTAEKENITADLGTHLTADMIDQVVPKLWNRLNSPGYPEIGPLAEDMDAISPFLAAHGADIRDGTYQHFLSGINKTAYLSLLVLAVKDLRQRVVELENA